MGKRVRSSRGLAAICSAVALLAGSVAAQDNLVRKVGSKPVGPAAPNASATGLQGNRYYKGPLVLQQKPPYNIIKVSYVPPSHWTVKMDVAGGTWTTWYCEFYSPAPPGQPPARERCIGIPKAQTALLKVRLDGAGPNAGKTAYISGSQWGGECAGSAGDTCKLDMSKSHDVIALTETLP